MKTMKDFAAQQLSKNQMSEVKGGTSCPEGQHAYNCVLTLGYLGQDTTGIVCGTSKEDAERQANAILAKVMDVTEEDRYVC